MVGHIEAAVTFSTFCKTNLTTIRYYSNDSESSTTCNTNSALLTNMTEKTNQKQTQVS